MKGTRPLDNSEIRIVSACFTGIFEARNRGLFMLGVSYWGQDLRTAQPNGRGCLPEPKARHRSPVRQIHRQRR